MEVVDYGLCQIVDLMNVFRPQGQAYFPEIAVKVATRYQFAKPPTLEDMNKEAIKFQIGRFNDVQILELAVYGDGIITNGKCPTEILEAFVEDLLDFSGKEIGIIPILTHRNEMHFESNIIVQSKADLAAFVAPAAESLIKKAIEDKIGITPQASGIVLDFDPGPTKMRRKPARFFIERKVGFKFEENLFLCIAPLRTKDHLDLLVALEREALSKSTP